MMLDVIRGSTTKPGATEELLRVLQTISFSDALLYIGYPVIATADEKVSIDALLISREFGLVAFHFPENAASAEHERDEILRALKSRLISHRDLAPKGELPFTVNVVSFFVTYEQKVPGTTTASPVTLVKTLQDFAPLEERYLAPLRATIQRVTTVRPARKRASVTRTSSRGGILKQLDRNIANLDHWQNIAAIETPAGLQRIRGLAGSGKTVVLALKAAYLHAQHPDWTIGLTFHTRSLYQQFRDLIRRFSFEHVSDEPDWDRLRLLHSWGSVSGPGLYSELALTAGLSPKDLTYAKAKYGQAEMFEGVCAELVDHWIANRVPPIFDAILIDEAQDLPLSFFRLAYLATKPPKRVVWAYDELQNLGAEPDQVPPPSELFAIAGAEPPPPLRNAAGQPHQDVVLPVCYRNTPWALATAHALGFGVYNKTGLIQMVADQSVWQEIGYEIQSGAPEAGNTVVVSRRTETSPAYFRELLKPEDAVQSFAFDNETDQYVWIADAIARNLQGDELEPSDILVILPNPLAAKEQSGPLMAELRNRGINSHLAGVTRSRDEFFTTDSVTISGVFRAKGNEAAMVYVANSNYCVEGYELIRKRNILFTAITRSRAWVRICGHGVAMKRLKEEFDAVVENGYTLKFTIPTASQLAKMRRIHRDMSLDERRKAQSREEQLRDAISAIESGEHIPEDVREKLRRLLNER
jgi:superfamily I DNA and RNA helicase